MREKLASLQFIANLFSSPLLELLFLRIGADLITASLILNTSRTPLRNMYLGRSYFPFTIGPEGFERTWIGPPRRN